jgi:hypothetical protein
LGQFTLNKHQIIASGERVVHQITGNLFKLLLTTDEFTKMSGKILKAMQLYTAKYLVNVKKTYY